MYEVMDLVSPNGFTAEDAKAFHVEFKKFFNQEKEIGKEDYVIRREGNEYVIMIMLDVYHPTGQQMDWMAVRNWLKQKLNKPV